MRRAFAVALVSYCGLIGLCRTAPAADGASIISQTLEGLHCLMIDCSQRSIPSDDEWNQLHESGPRSGGLGGLGDFKSKSIVFMNTRYYTANPSEGTLSSFGKLDGEKRYDRFGHIKGVAFSIEQNSWKQRHVVNAAALAQLAGSRFLEFAGVGFDAALKEKRMIEVTFVGTTVPKDEAIRRLNMDADALEYLETLHREREKHDSQPVKLFAGKGPPAPRIVLSNVIMLDGTFSNAMDASADGKLYSRILDDGVELKVVKQGGDEVTLLSPVVRAYRTYAIEFKKDHTGRMARSVIRDAFGNTRQVPQVFDLTPDL